MCTDNPHQAILLQIMILACRKVQSMLLIFEMQRMISCDFPIRTFLRIPWELTECYLSKKANFRKDPDLVTGTLSDNTNYLATPVTLRKI